MLLVLPLLSPLSLPLHPLRTPPPYRPGLCVVGAGVLAHTHRCVKLAKVTTLGGRVEDTFLVQGPELQNNARQIQIETELLKELSS